MSDKQASGSSVAAPSATRKHRTLHYSGKARPLAGTAEPRLTSKDLLILTRGAQLRSGAGCTIDRGTTVDVSDNPLCQVGSRTSFGHHCTVAARSSVRIGTNCLTSESLSIRDHDRDVARPDLPTRDGERC